MFDRNKTPPVQPGLRFVKVGDTTRTVWNVEAVWTATDGIPHARLTAAPIRMEVRTISVATLGDRDEWLPFADAKKADQHD